MSRKETKYIKLAKTLFKVLTKMRIPRYRSKFSNHIYTVWQHCVFLMIKEESSRGYRRLVDLLEECSALLNFLGLGKVPHFTTLQKFAQKFKSSYLAKILGGFIRITRVRKLHLGIDSTGYTLTRASHYYLKTVYGRSNKRKSRRGKQRKRKKYLKVTTTVETRKQLPLTLKIRRGPANDNRDFKPAVGRAAEIKPIEISVADKGYDSEDNHEFVHSLDDAECIIPPKYEDVPVWRTAGRYRKRMKRGYSKKKYHQRNMTETMHSVIKRLFGDGIRSVKVGMQNKEIYWRHIAYASYRIVELFLWIMEGFYAAGFI